MMLIYTYGYKYIELARNTSGCIYALDTHEPFLGKLNENAKEEKVENKIKTIKGLMFTLEKYFEKSELDVIWSESAIFIIGFEEGLKKWKPFLKKEGHMVVSEISWIKENIPKEIKEFWEADYSSMNNIEDNLKIVEQCGYKLIDYFIIPESSWWNNYYDHLERRISILRKVHSNSEE
ncbi:hypothetical protein RBU61_05895 [Tissierella sp. MB52-C2]|uniref:hypothetical protein n=1 Tax=Tissierella sp. MB52-C2 TaxID=3070999 RepID=UPI00280B92EA|nr:hypothetical protein [Tissierella sp. MB52-C2]WMM26205.1 hypothetical protein RBU61_05895 [Tissierella sp. MB52-C2]